MQEIDFVSVAQAAEILDVSDMTIRRYINSGELRAVQKSGKKWTPWRIARSDVEAKKRREEELFREKYGPELQQVESH